MRVIFFTMTYHIEEWKSLQEEFRAAKRKQVLDAVLANETST